MTSTNAEDFYNTYKQAGFHFPTSTLTTYALSLYTKPFVILSGISGTGKTKIAQLFNTFEIASVEKQSTCTVLPEELLFITVRDGWVYGDGRTNFKYEALSSLLTEDEINDIEPEKERLIAEGKTNQYSPLYDFTIETPEGDELPAKFYLQRPKNPLVRIRFISKRGDTNPYDITKYFRDKYNDGDIVEFQKINDKRLRIVENSQDNIEDIKDELEAKEISLIDRKCFVSVRSDWTDSTELFGYYNLIEQQYHITKLLKFILKANEHPDYPFFVILDEMNLSKVEHYFSDFLSCLESRFYDNKDTLVQEKINLHAINDLMETDDTYFDLIQPSIELPKNLYITGTVNIDESTYMFSPKVLDRANVIEFNEVDLDAYGSDSFVHDGEYKLTIFPNFAEFTLATKASYELLPDFVKKHLVNLNNILKEYNLHFGYRTVNEVALYISNAMKYINDTNDTQFQALDLQLVQKIFPKLNGSYATLEAPLQKVLLYLSEQDELSKIRAIDTKFPKTIAKLQRMYAKLSTSGYSIFMD